MAKTTKIQVLRSNYPVKPPISILDDGVIAINNRKNKEKIYFKSEDNENIVEFDPTSTIMAMVDEKIENTDIGHLQEQIDIINGGDNVEGSFEHADKLVKEELTNKINNKVEEVVGSSSIRVNTETVGNSSKVITIESIIDKNDLVLYVDDVKGITATVKLELSGNTVSLIGRNGVVISSVVVPGMNLNFNSTDSININNNEGNISANVKIDGNSDNRISVSSEGIFSSRIINCGKY